MVASNFSIRSSFIIIRQWVEREIHPVFCGIIVNRKCYTNRSTLPRPCPMLEQPRLIIRAIDRCSSSSLFLNPYWWNFNSVHSQCIEKTGWVVSWIVSDRPVDQPSMARTRIQRPFVTRQSRKLLSQHSQGIRVSHSKLRVPVRILDLHFEWHVRHISC
jgi:hypothetical protein